MATIKANSITVRVCARPVSPVTMLHELSFVSPTPRSRSRSPFAGTTIWSYGFNNSTTRARNRLQRSKDQRLTILLASIVGRPRHHG